MKNIRGLIDQITSGDLPTWVLVGVGLLLFIIALKVAKGLLKIVFIALALAALVGAGWWFLHKQGRL